MNTLLKLGTGIFTVLLIFSAQMVSAGDNPPSPLDGYTIHVSAPHMMDGEVIGPFHHYCKPINNQIIQCILFEGTGPNARLTEIEYMVAKDLVKKEIPKWSHRQNWHDHDEEIKTGRVAVHYPTDPKVVKGLVDHVANTDGIIFHLWPDGAPIPDGSVMIAQSVGHWEALHGKVSDGSGSSASQSRSSDSKPSASVSEMLKRLGIKETHGSQY